jgi:hypothetical protein
VDETWSVERALAGPRRWDRHAFSLRSNEKAKKKPTKRVLYRQASGLGR